jgi:hypothetical protein
VHALEHVLVSAIVAGGKQKIHVQLGLPEACESLPLFAHSGFTSTMFAPTVTVSSVSASIPTLAIVRGGGV